MLEASPWKKYLRSMIPKDLRIRGKDIWESQGNIPYFLYSRGLISPTLTDLSCGVKTNAVVPFLDREILDESSLSQRQLFWRREGYLVLPSLIPTPLIDSYCRIRQNSVGEDGWKSSVPYMVVPEMRDIGLFPTLRNRLDELMSEEMCLSLALTGWISTERNWHQDDYLNPPWVNGYYMAVWIALDNISPDCGPFQFVPGSHRWPHLQGYKVKRYLRGAHRRSPAWPKFSEKVLDPIFATEIQGRKAKVNTFLGKKGDVLVWHSKLAHRGSIPIVPGMPRKSLICHYTARSKSGGRKLGSHPGGGRFHLVPEEL